jgi:hypothetical protein
MLKLKLVITGAKFWCYYIVIGDNKIVRYSVRDNVLENTDCVLTDNYLLDYYPSFLLNCFTSKING